VDGRAGVGEVVSDTVDDAAEGTADGAAASAVVGTKVSDEAGVCGMELGPAIAVTGCVWGSLGDDGWPRDEPAVGDRPAWVPASVRLLVRSVRVMC